MRMDDELTQAMGHIGSELYMLCAVGARLRDGDILGDDAVRAACIESVLIHARVLRDFFIGHARYDDLNRTEFAAGADWQPTPEQAVARLRAQKESVDKFLAHLTWSRVDVTWPELDYQGIVQDVLAIAEAWAEHLRDRNRGMYWPFHHQCFLARRIYDDRLDMVWATTSHQHLYSLRVLQRALRTKLPLRGQLPGHRGARGSHHTRESLIALLHRWR